MWEKADVSKNFCNGEHQTFLEKKETSIAFLALHTSATPQTCKNVADGFKNFYDGEYHKIFEVKNVY